MIRGLVLAVVLAATRSTYMDECSDEQDEVYSCGHAAKEVYQECMDALD